MREKTEARLQTQFVVLPSDLDKVSMKPDGFAIEALKAWIEGSVNGLAEDFPARQAITIDMTITRAVA